MGTAGSTWPISRIYPPNTGNDYKDWEKATALGELPRGSARPEGHRYPDGEREAGAGLGRDVERLRIRLTEAHLAVKMGL